jgi:hypothetical protein
MEDAAEMISALHEKKLLLRLEPKLGRWKALHAEILALLRRVAAMENRNRSRLESWEIAGERESHPEVPEERRGYRGDGRLLENMNAG